MTTKKIFLVIILFTVTAVSFCQEKAFYYVNKDDRLNTYYYSLPHPDEISGKVYKGEPITKIGGEVYIFSSSDKKINRVEVSTKNNWGWLNTNSISVYNSEILPDEITENEWTNSYYLDVMRQGNRDALFAYEPFWRDYFYKYKDGYTVYEHEPKEWYEICKYIPQFEFRNIYAKLYFTNCNEYTFILGRILKNDGAFFFQATCTNRRIEFDEKETGISFNLVNKYNDGNNNTGKYNMMLILDGDYLDVYINGEKTFSLIKLTEEIKNQFENLMEYNKCDLSNITFPKRVYGSTDYPKPELPTYTYFFQEENGMPAYLYRSPEIIFEKNALPKNNADKTSLPIWAWFAIIGGAVVVVGGGTVVFALKRK
jgi:hypothetical protein